METDKDLRLLAVKIFLFVLPVLLLIVLSVVVDPFRIYRDYDDYNKDNFVSLNREFVCLKLYDRNIKSVRYDSFIFGNSRSQAFKVQHWLRYLPPGSEGFHFDGAGGGLYGIHNRIRYIDETGGKLAHALVLVDEQSLSCTRNAKGFLFVSPPELSGESSLSFYSEFTKPLLNLTFVVGYLDFSIFGTHRKYMSSYISRPKYNDLHDSRTGDVYYGADRMIFQDMEGYYKGQSDKGVFYDRQKRAVVHRPVSKEERELLSRIKGHFDKHGTDYRIVVSPLYDQVPLGEDHLRLLIDIFGAQAVYDYSGVNRFTASIFNYYEDSHFRPHVSAEILKEIYSRAE